jgi:hypothetical protein
MQFTKMLVCAAVIMSAASVASAQEQTASLNSCTNMSGQVKSALDSNQQSSNYEAARKESRMGQEYCTNTFYATGVAHYEQALKLLGVAPQNMAQKN